jgi:sulfate transport system substrate-binding protein
LFPTFLALYAVACGSQSPPAAAPPASQPQPTTASAAAAQPTTASAAKPAAAGAATPAPASGPNEILNVSYDPTRELYQDISAAFAKDWKGKNGQDISVKQSNGGSGSQARAVIDGLQADVVTLALSADIDAIQKAGLISEGWAKRLPNNSVPYYSTIILVVAAGNPHGIKDFGDLVQPGLQVITPNPKTSGGARWNYLAAWAWAEKAYNNDAAKIKDFMGKLYKNVAVLDSGARASTNTFAQRGIGDVLIAWENDAFLAVGDPKTSKFEIIVPAQSIRADTPVSVVDKVVDKRGTRAVAEGFLQFLYTPTAQDIAGKRYFRPTSDDAAKKYDSQFPKLDLITIDHFGGWAKVQQDHFADGGIFDQIYQPKG